MASTVLEVRNLVTTFDTEAGVLRAVDGVSFALARGETLGVVGESGCGKSVTALSLLRLLPKPSGRIASGEVLFNGKDLTRLSPREMHAVRGRHISMIFQEPMTALNPVHRIEDQLKEVFSLHFPALTDAEKRQRALKILEQVGIAAPAARLREYPHQLSGGMRQRVMIAIALACEPSVLIADEPTTALDVTIQAQILDVMRDMQERLGMGLLFITHDLGVIAELSDHVLVMYGGQVVETASAQDLFHSPRHPYTQGLLSSIPRLTGKRKTMLRTIKGMVPSLLDLPKGCRFANRCPFAGEICATSEPPLETAAAGHEVRCHFWRDLKERA